MMSGENSSCRFFSLDKDPGNACSGCETSEIAGDEIFHGEIMSPLQKYV